MSKVRLLGHSLLWFFTVGVFVLAVLLALSRFYIVKVDEYKVDVEQYLSEEIGEKVSINKMSARMEGFKPEVRFLGIKLVSSQKQSAPLSVGELRLLFNPLSLLQGYFTPEKITLAYTDISIKRFSDGHISLLGIPEKNKDQQVAADFSWLLADGVFHVVDSRVVWQDAMRDAVDIELTNAQITFQNKGDQHTLRVQATLPEAMGGPFKLSMRFNGNVLSGADWRAEGYLKAENVDLPHLMSRLDLNVELPQIETGMAELELWSSWDKAHVSQVKGFFSVKNTLLKSVNSQLELQRFGSQFNWRKAAKGWQLSVNGLSFQTKKVLQKASRLSVHYLPVDGKGYRLSMASDQLNLAAVSNVLKNINILDETKKSTLAQLQISGELVKSHLIIVADKQIPRWAFCGQLKNYSNHAFDKIPGVKNVTASACSTQERGWLDVNTQSGSVNFKGLFRDPLLLEKVVARLTWLKDQQGWSIKSKQLFIDTPHIKTESRLAIKLPEGEVPLIDLQTKFGSADGVNTPHYLPVGVMPKSVVRWLDNGIINANVIGGGVLLKGALSDFPYRNNEGVFQVLFNVEEAKLHYADQWPDINSISARVEFKNQGLRIETSEATITGNSIKKASVVFTDLEKSPYLQINGLIEDDISGLYQFLKQSPLHKSMSGLIDQSEVSGQTKLELDLQIPLRKKLEPKISGDAYLTDNSLRFPELDLSIKNIQGVVHLSEHGLNAKGITGKLWGEGVNGSINHTGDQTRIQLGAKLAIKTLAKRYPADLWKKLSGESQTTLWVDVPDKSLAGEGITTLTLKSNLQGLAIDLPQPVGKPKNKKSALKVTTKLEPANLRIGFLYADQLRGTALFKKNKLNRMQFDRADLHLGMSRSSLPKNKGLKLSGHVATLNIDQWQQALVSKNGGAVPSSVLNQLDLSVTDLYWSGRTFKQVSVVAENNSSVWQGKIHSDSLSGSFSLPEAFDDNNHVELDLERLNLPKITPKQTNIDLPDIKPADLPNLNLNAQHFFMDGTDIGTLGLALKRKKTGLMIESLTLKSARDELNAYGAWEQDSLSSKTALKGELNSQSLGGLLKDMGILKDLKDAESTLHFDLNWPNSPQGFSKDELSGVVSLKSGKGRLLSIEPGIGRVFGVLSLETLQRRLQLDFSDLVQKGLSFDSIKGRFNILNGDAQTDGFYLKSPSARLDIVGRVGLANEDYDQLITVTPQTSESLPVAGALAGGPLLGAAVFVVQKIAGSTFNKVGAYQYHVTGGWDDPQIKQLSQPGGKVFDFVGNIFSSGSSKSTEKKNKVKEHN